MISIPQVYIIIMSYIHGSTLHIPTTMIYVVYAMLCHDNTIMMSLAFMKSYTNTRTRDHMHVLWAVCLVYMVYI